ncbi:MAG: hypothetical protein LC118_21030 [Dehalococcoidia bacterium]|nr:hypothetical protein [Dehalococcoidia bacterium]
MNLRPYTVARFGVYVALAIAALSVWLGQQAGATLDFSLMRAVFIFVIFTALGFGAEAVLSAGLSPPIATPPAEKTPQQTDD